MNNKIITILESVDETVVRSTISDENKCFENNNRNANVLIRE